MRLLGISTGAAMVCVPLATLIWRVVRVRPTALTMAYGCALSNVIWRVAMLVFRIVTVVGLSP